jgi:FlgD Ig-like domain
MPASRVAPALALVAICLAPRAWADPVVPGFTVDVYSPASPPPVRLAFDGDGNLYVGVDAPFPTPGSILRVPPGGVPQSHGDPLPDPDAVIVPDSTSLVAVTEGSVLVGGVFGVSEGYVMEIRPDQTGQYLWGPTSAFENPNDFAFDGQGRLFFADSYTGKVHVSTGGLPVPFCSVPSPPSALAIDASDRVFTWSTDGVIRIYDAFGALVDGAFATAPGTFVDLAFGPGGVWGTDLYTVANGELLRIDASGAATVAGTGFSVVGQGVTGLAFGPDGALYASEYVPQRILRIAPSPVGAAVGPLAADGSRLLPPSPSPFSRRTGVAFSLDRAGFAQVDVCDVAGRRIRHLLAGDTAAGRHALSWDGRDESGRSVASGVYFVRLRLDGVPRDTQRAVLRR